MHEESLLKHSRFQAMGLGLGREHETRDSAVVSPWSWLSHPEVSLQAPLTGSNL